MTAAAPDDFREEARRRLPRFLFDYVDGGANAEITLGRNIADMAQVELRQRVMVDVSDTSLETELFGLRQSLPVALAPIGLTGMFARRGEVQAARAATRAGVPFCLSTVSICSLAEVTEKAASPVWFQLYNMRDRGVMRALIDQARDRRCPALVFTVDTPVSGIRYRDARWGLTGPRGAWRRRLQIASRPGWAWRVGVRGGPHALGNLATVIGEKRSLEDYFKWLIANFDASLRWSDLEWIRDAWPGPLIIKGILDPEDALAAAALGADGLVVSNHGGRQLDGVTSTIRTLPKIAEVAGDRLTVLADSGVRSGLDVIRLLASGAKGVLLGRPWVYALASGGEASVTALLAMIEREMRVGMALAGVRDVSSIDRSLLAASR